MVNRFLGSHVTIAIAAIVTLYASLPSQAQAARFAETRDRQSLQLQKIRVNRVELHYLKRGHGVPIIFVHGGLDDYRMWDAQIKPFAEHYLVVAYSRRYNYPNHNRSVRPDHSAIVEAEDLAALIKKLRLKRVHIVGHSYGALTALFLAVRHPELVRTLILAEPPVIRWAQDTPEGRTLFNEFIEALWKPAGDALRLGQKEQALRLTVKYFAGEGAFDEASEELHNYWRANLREWQALTTSRDAFPPLLREDIKKIKVPVLMLSGERTLEILRFVDGQLQPLLQNGERVVIRNASHDMWGEQPVACRRSVLAFLTRYST